MELKCFIFPLGDYISRLPVCCMWKVLHICSKIVGHNLGVCLDCVKNLDLYIMNWNDESVQCVLYTIFESFRYYFKTFLPHYF